MCPFVNDLPKPRNATCLRCTLSAEQCKWWINHQPAHDRPRRKGRFIAAKCTPTDEYRRKWLAATASPEGNIRLLMILPLSLRMQITGGEVRYAVSRSYKRHSGAALESEPCRSGMAHPEPVAE